MFQRHPFTLVSTQPAEFVIQAQDGFTKALHLAASRNPGGRFRAAIEGPYCVAPKTRGYDKVILIAGGTGVTFTIAMALDWARRHRMLKQRNTLDFVWVVRNKACLEWFDAELLELRARLGVSISLFVSGATSSNREKSASPSIVQHLKESADSFSSVHLPSSREEGHEKMAHGPSNLVPASSRTAVNDFSIGRPDLAMLIANAVSGLAVQDRVLVAGW